jgi:hypothetical protein
MKVIELINLLKDYQDQEVMVSDGMTQTDVDIDGVEIKDGKIFLKIWEGA